jgi:hypothetical protein
MKITIQDEDLTVSIDNHFEVTTATEARDLCVSALLAKDVDDAIREGVKESLECAAGSI